MNEQDAVGYYMVATLVNDMTVEGTIFTFNPEEGIIALLQDVSPSTSTVQMIRTDFIKSYELSTAEKDKQLPQDLDSFGNLPSMQTGRGKSIFKQVSSHLKEAENSRQKMFRDIDPETPIAACDIYQNLLRVYPTTEWEPEEGLIKIDDVVVYSDDGWATPSVTLTAGSEKTHLKERIEKHLSKMRK